MTEPVLQMRSIVKTFGGVRALDGVTLTVMPGEVHAICGENGAGKSTLMKVLSGVHPHGSYEGEILLDGKTAEFKSIRDSEREGIVIIHQELALVQHLSIAENIFLGNEHARAGVVSWHRTTAHARELLARVGLRDHPGTRIADIGVGKQQLVEIAKALSKKVRVLILDEPTAALNDDDSEHLLDLVLEFKRQGITCLIISHKLGEVMRVSDSVTILRDGRSIETMRVGVDEVTEDRIIRGMVGRDLTHRFPERTPRIGEVAMEVHDWTVHHPIDQRRKVVDGVSLNVRRGEIVGLAGLMGSGRTEWAMSLFGRSYGHGVSGRVVKDGKEITTRTVRGAIAHGVAYVTEDRKQYGLNLIDDIARNISLASLPELSNLLGVVDAGTETQVAEGHRRSMNIRAATIRQTVGGLSGGNQQKVVLGKWLQADPDVLILDEPTRGIDVGAKFEIYKIIHELADRGKAIVMISSELPELLGMSDRIYVLNEGRLTAEVPRQDATQELLMRYMTMGRAAS